MEVCISFIPIHNRIADAISVDSLVAVEVRNWLIRELQADISVFDILGTIPISALSVKIVEMSKLLTKKFDAETQKDAPVDEEKGIVKTEIIEVAAVEKEALDVKLLSSSIPIMPAAEPFKNGIIEAIEEVGSSSDSEGSLVLVEAVE